MSVYQFEEQDWSGMITVAHFTDEAPVESGHQMQECAVPEDFVVVGGGAEGALLPNGNLLTASEPEREQLMEWRAESKDHIHPSPHRLRTYALGMKIEGYSRQRLAANIQVLEGSSHYGVQNWPEAWVDPDTELRWTLLGGGFHVFYNGAGNIATGSFPEFIDGTGDYPAFTGRWRARSKDHGPHDASTINAYGIYIRSILPNGERIESTVNSSSSWNEQGGLNSHCNASVTLEHGGYALTGIGAEARSYGTGQLLYSLHPKRRGAVARSKDHGSESLGTVTAYALGIRVAG